MEEMEYSFSEALYLYQDYSLQFYQQNNNNNSY